MVRLRFLLFVVLLESALYATDRIEPGIGKLTLDELDLTLTAGPLSLEIRRLFDSGMTSPGPLGKGWTLSIEKRLIRTRDAIEIREFNDHGSPGRDRALQCPGFVRGRDDVSSKRLQRRRDGG